MAALMIDRKLLYQWIGNQLAAMQIGVKQANSGDTAVFIGGIVVDAVVAAAAGGVQGDFLPVISQTAAAPGLGYGIQNVKELTQTGFFCVFRQRI